MRPLRVFIYGRVSTADQADHGTSLDKQQEECRAYAAARGWIVVGYIVEDISGAYLERPGLDQVRAAVRAGQVDVLLVYALDRLSRDQLHPSIIFDELRRHQAILHSVTEGRIATAEDLIRLALYAYVAHQEREKIRERSMDGRRRQAQKGKLTAAGTNLYGTHYLKGEGRRIPVEDEAHVVEEIFRWVADEHLSQHAIVMRLMAREIPSPTGKRTWHESTIRNMIRNPAYKGLAYQNKWQCVQPKKRRNPSVAVGRNAPRPESEWYLVPGDVTPRLVSDYLWQRANDVLASHARFFPRTAARPYLLTSRMVCAECGCRYHGWYTFNKERDKEYLYYKCGKGHDPVRCKARALPLVETERAVWEYVCAVLAEPRRVIAELEAQRTAQGESQAVADLANVREQIHALDAKESRLLDLALESADAMVTGVFAEKRRAIVAEREAWQREETRLVALVADEEQFRLTAAKIETVERFCANVRANLADATFDRKREVLEALNVKVTVDTRSGERRMTVAGWLPTTDLVVIDKSLVIRGALRHMTTTGRRPKT
jgi:site-specific DNA recombinase